MKRKFKNLKEGDILYRVRYESGHIADISKIPIIEISDFDGYTKFVLPTKWFLLSKEELNTEAKHGDDSYYCCNKKFVEELIKKDIKDFKMHHKNLIENFEF